MNNVNIKKLTKEFSDLFEYPLYFCGGYVRDKLMGLDSYSDIDICSKYRPDEIKDICKKNNIQTIDTGIKHGTITILIDGESIEHTTFRKDVSCDGRHSIVEYSDSIFDDSKRRDFTINSIYMNIKTGEVIDFHNGVEHIVNRKLIFVGNPVDRILEDNLRMLRYFRFANRFDIEIDDNIYKIFEKYSYLLENLSKERIRTEIDKMLTEIIRYDILLSMTKLFYDYNAFFKICHRMFNTSSKNNKHHTRDNVLEHSYDVYKKGIIWMKGY